MMPLNQGFDTDHGEIHSNKRRRTLPEWEKSLVKKSTERSGLADLFERSGESVRNQNVSNRQANSGGANRQGFGANENDFFTLHLQHRQPTNYSANECLYVTRNRQSGPIARIVFEYRPAAANYDDDIESLDEKSRQSRMSQATIVKLEVKEDYQGYDLGGLLFSEALAALRNRYQEGGEDEEDNICVLSASVFCKLDAEEDIRRYNKLISFYEKLGCQVKPNVSRFEYIHHNDWECYRRVPMQIVLCAPSTSNGRHAKRGSDFMKASLVQKQGPERTFLPVKFLEPCGNRITVDAVSDADSRHANWLIIESDDKRIQFRTTLGQYLVVEEGRCRAKDAAFDDSSTWFFLHRVPDSASRSDEESPREEAPSRRKELWMLESALGSFLSFDAESNRLEVSKSPAFWQSNSRDLTLTCTSGTLLRRLHYRKSWSRQTVAFVQAMRERYLGFKLQKMSLLLALEYCKAVPAFPFRLCSSNGPSLRTLSFLTAEAARSAGQPDWVQLVALMHALGRFAPMLDRATEIDVRDDYDWTILSRSRVVGCAAPDRASFAEFRCLNPDERKPEYCTPQGMYDLRCGLENVLLTWSGSEYMYYMLQHNNASIPEEGLAMLRYFTLEDWHTHNEYDMFATDDELQLKAFIAEFDELHRSVLNRTDLEEMSDEQCEVLWNQHYGYIVEKFGLTGELSW